MNIRSADYMNKTIMMVTIILSYSCIMVFANAAPTTTSSSGDTHSVQDGSIIYPAFTNLNRSRLTSQAALESMFTKMQLGTLAFAAKMENLLHFDKRCSSETLAACAGRSHHGCNSELPAATCPGYQYAVASCGKGVEGGCSGIFDFDTSTVVYQNKEKDFSFSSTSRGISDREKDGICSTLPAEEYMRQAMEESKTYWDMFSVAPPGMYFGSNDGVFRMLPGYSFDCPYGDFTFDPRVRPWYVGASSGPKDIIIVLDTSGSMNNLGRMDIMKAAAKRVIGTLNFADYFAVVEFNDYASRVGNNGLRDLLQRASDVNKAKVLDSIDNLLPGGSTNFRSGFELAFQTFQQSDNVEQSSGCHQAILFLTDGEMTDNETAFFDLIDRKRNGYSDSGREPPVMFTYSFGSTAASKAEVPKRIACEYGGVWASIEDGGNLAESMGAYYKYFAQGLGSSGVDSVSWTEPYEFATGLGLGTTASAPVYDRSVTPPIFVGVVGVDISFSAMEIALGENQEATRDVFIKKITELSVASCHTIDIEECQLQSLRKFGSGDKANDGAACSNSTCSSSINSLRPINPDLCDETYPFNLWANEASIGRSYEEKTCCTVGEEVVYNDDVCKEPKSKIGLIVGLSIGGIIMALIPYYCVMKFMIKKRKMTAETAPPVIASAPIAPPQRKDTTLPYAFPISSQVADS